MASRPIQAGPETDPHDLPVDEQELVDKLSKFNLLLAPGHLLRRNHQRSYDIFQKHVGNSITRQQFALLLALNQHPGAAQKDLVEATGIDKSTLREMLDRMVARHWVLRERDPNDSRAWTMQITPEGRQILIDYIDKVETAQREILSPLTDDEQAMLLRLLRVTAGLAD